jgi:hypothetical protein
VAESTVRWFDVKEKNIVEWLWIPLNSSNEQG